MIDLKKKKRQIPPALIAILIGIICIIVFVVGRIADKYTPTKEIVDASYLEEVYGVSVDDTTQIALIMQDNISEEKAFWENDTIYLNYNFVKSNINSRFYWDNNENVLIYTLPTDVIKSDVGSQEYYGTTTRNSTNYTIVKTDGTNVFIALEYVKLYSNIEYEYYTEPNRLCITYIWGDKEVCSVKENTQVRTGAGIKKRIVKELSKGEVVTVLSEGKGWKEIVTEDGFFGYVKNSHLNKKETVNETNENYEEPVYTSISRNHKISMAWHMVISPNDNNSIVDLTANAKGMNVVSPTWFRIIDNEGNVSSLADTTYVNRAHQLGMEVWAMVDDQSDQSSNAQVFTYTSKRENLINQLISSAIQYGFDGINVDFEYITADFAEDYVQFLRELSVKCRNNGIVLSIDDKVPLGFNEYYNRKEQGIIADYVIVMAYDEYWGTDSGAGSTASIGWVRDGVENTLASVDSSKLILGVPFYTKVWGESADGTVQSYQTADMQTVENLIASNGSVKNWLEDKGQNYSEYSEGDITYRIWVEDATSIEKKVQLISEFDLAGVSAWRLGCETPDIWNTIVKYTN